MGYSTKTKHQDSFYRQYTLQQLIEEVLSDIPNINKYNQEQYEEWFSHVYPIDELINMEAYNAYTVWILSQGKPLKQRLEQWLNLVTIE